MKDLIRLKNKKDEFLDFEEFKNSAKELATNWAKTCLDDPYVVYVDIETTGLPKNGVMPEIVQISILNYRGLPLFSAILKPEIGVIPNEVSKVHRIYMEDVLRCPTFKEISGLVSFFLQEKTVICYNAAFDIKIITHWLNYYEQNVNYFPECAMIYYAAWLGEWSQRKKDFKWQKLPKLAYGKAHNSLIDCMSTLELLRLMANEQKENEISLDF